MKHFGPTLFALLASEIMASFLETVHTVTSIHKFDSHGTHTYSRIHPVADVTIIRTTKNIVDPASPFLEGGILHPPTAVMFRILAALSLGASIFSPGIAASSLTNKTAMTGTEQVSQVHG